MLFVMTSIPHTDSWPSLQPGEIGRLIMEAGVGVSRKYMPVLVLIAAIPQSKPMSQSFQEHSLLFSGPIAGFSSRSSLHSGIKRGDTDISVPSKSVCEIEHV